MIAGKSDLWLTRQQAADLIELSPRQFDAVLRPRLPKEAERGSGKTLRIHGPAIVSALVDYRLEQAKPVPSDDDPLLAASGGDSPNLERYRLAKAMLAERDLAERDRDVVRRAVIAESLRPAVSGMRTAGDKLVSQFGNDAGDIYNEAVNDFEAAVVRTIERMADAADRSDGGTVPRARPGRAHADAAVADAN